MNKHLIKVWSKNATQASQQTLGKFDQNAPQKESEEAIAANIEYLTGNKPEIINTKKPKVLYISSYLNFYCYFKIR